MGVGVDPRASGCPLVIRYTNEYAAAVATGLWKPRKHKEMAAKAKRAWEQLRQQRDGTVYIQHAPAAQQWAAKAADLAARGKTGEQVYMLWPA